MDKIFFFNPTGGFHDKQKAFDEGIFYPRFGLETWLDQTFFKLQKRGLGDTISLVDNVPESGIIIFHSGYFEKNLKPKENQLFVSISADYGRNRFAQVHLFQNPSQRIISWKNKRLFIDSLFPFCGNYFIPHWSQPNIINRKIGENKLVRIGYFGRLENFDVRIVSELSTFCKENDLVFEVVEDWTKWNNYKDFDLVLAIRDFDKKNYFHKPFSKILNALLAGVPVIAGNETSAIYFKKVYFPSLPIVSSMEELFLMISKIRDNYHNYLVNVQSVSVSLKNNYDNELQSNWIQFISNASFLLKKWKASSKSIRNFFLKSREF